MPRLDQVVLDEAAGIDTLAAGRPHGQLERSERTVGAKHIDGENAYRARDMQPQHPWPTPRQQTADEHESDEDQMRQRDEVGEQHLQHAPSVSHPATVTHMRRVPWWAVLSATAAPVLLIGGWTLAASRQQANFNSITDTISALAAHGATDRWIMTTALAGLGVCHVVTALGLHPAALPGRVVLAIGGLANIAVAAFPQPDGGGSSPAHVQAATVGFVALAVWPAQSWRRDRQAPFALHLQVAAVATAVLLGSSVGSPLSCTARETMSV